MGLKSTDAGVDAQYSQAQLQEQIDKQRYALGEISGLQYQQSKNNADQLTAQHKISLEQLDVNQKAIIVQLAVVAIEDRPGARPYSTSTRNRSRNCRCGPASPASSVPCPCRFGWASM